MTGRLICLLLIFSLFLATPIQAQGAVPVVVKLSSWANLATVNSLLGGTVIDSIPGANTHLLSLPSLPLLSPLLKLLGVEWLETNAGTKLLPVLPVGELKVPSSLPPDWYHDQPALQLIESRRAREYSTG